MKLNVKTGNNECKNNYFSCHKGVYHKNVKKFKNVKKN